MTNGTGHRATPPLYDERSSTMRAASGSWRTRAAGHATEVLPLALAGLAALGHRGAFGADGASSDGAGVSLPLDRSVLELLAGASAAARPAVLRFLPRGRSAGAAGRELIERIFGEAGCRSPLARRSVRSRCPRARGRCGPTGVQPGDRGASGRGVRHADRRRRLRTTPRRCSPARGERSARRGRRPRRAGDRPRRAGPWSTRASSRAPGSPSCTRPGRTARGPLRALPPALRDEHASRVAPRPALPGDRPQRRDQHRPRQPGAGPGALPGPRREADRGRADRRRPAALAGRADSLSLDEGLELLTTTGWDLAEALLAAIPEALTLRRAPHPHVATFRRRTAGFLAPWDGPAALVFADGRRVGAMVDRNGLRPPSRSPPAGWWRSPRGGAVPLTSAETVRRGRLGPGQMLLVDPGRRQVLEDAEAKA